VLTAHGVNRVLTGCQQGIPMKVTHSWWSWHCWHSSHFCSWHCRHS